MPILPHYFSDDGPGAVLAIATEGKPPRIETCGFADLESRSPITAETVFDLASVGKMITATVALALVERGDLELTTPLDTVLSEAEAPREGRAITVRDLLQHTAGIPDYLEGGISSDESQLTLAAILTRLPEWTREARPGMVHTYSNTNYVLIAQLIERITGQPFAEFLEAGFFGPLGLRSTATLGGTRKPESTVKGYQNLGFGLPAIEATENLEIETVGDGGIFSSANDLIEWQSRYWSGEIIAPKSIRSMTTSGTLDSGEPFDYGLGIQVEERAGRRWFGHGGSWTASTTFVGYHEAERTSIIILSNEMMAPVERISQAALRELG